MRGTRLCGASSQEHTRSQGLSRVWIGDAPWDNVQRAMACAQRMRSECTLRVQCTFIKFAPSSRCHEHCECAVHVQCT